MKKKIAFFDFDNTLIRGDSFIYLLCYYHKQHPYTCLPYLRFVVMYIAYCLRLVPFCVVKAAMLFPLQNMSKKQIQEFYEQEVEPHFYANVVAALQQKKQDGYLIYIVSASVEEYLQYCRLPVDKIIGTKIKRQNGNIKIVGNNCKKEAKVQRIQEQLEKEGITIDYDHSFAYSDSNSDIPMLKLVKNRIRVEKKTGAMRPFITRE